MSEILYIQTEKNVEVYQPEVYLQDVGKACLWGCQSAEPE